MLKLETAEEAVGLLSLEEVHLEKAQLDQLAYRHRSETFARVFSYLAIVLDLSKRILLFLLPSFVSTAIAPPQVRKDTPLRPTAYLDGLRGLAAWAVFNSHLSALLLKTTGAGWGHIGENKQFYKLPILRLVYKGDFAVGLFFVISGFALSIGPIMAMKKHPRDRGAAMEKIAGTILRRPLRLYLPTFASTLIVFFLIRANVFGSIVAQQSKFDEYIWGWPVVNSWPKRNPSFFAQLLDLLKDNANMLSVFKQAFDGDFHTVYNGVLWTVKLEFRSSFVLYLTHAALFFMRKPVRSAITVFLIISGISIGALDFPLFWAGYLIAEYFEPNTDMAQERTRHILKSAAYWLLLILGSLMGSLPEWDAKGTPIFAWLIPFTPFNYPIVSRFWSGFGASLVIFAIPKLPTMLKIYNSALVQYMGKISFGFYLVHFWIVHIFGTLVFYHVWAITGKENPILASIGFVIAYSIVVSITIWVADVFWRAVDKPCVSFAGFVQKRLFEEL